MTTTDTTRATAWATAADQLIAAERTATPCAPVRDLLTDPTVEDGYEIQRLVNQHRDTADRRVGRKIGLTAPAVQAQLGIEHPDFGVLYASMAYGDGETIAFTDLLQPQLEAEIAFVLGADLPEHRVTTADVIRAVDVIVPSIEVCASRIADWNIRAVDTVADNASSGAYILGGAPRRLTDVEDLKDVAMELGADGEVIGSGLGAESLGHPVTAVTWLANEVAARGEPLRAGETILSGSLGELIPVRPGTDYVATFHGLGTVAVSFSH
ncbi:MAG: fumarylacetoacetate hydrolase family protein [Actinomycetota bacterium]